ncbi:PQQ-dependent sugar dehydrogenase [Mucilaginibacter antarcticus]|uniref:PQQ-dependent sugar dehydrogenase n=1 Tax=Mucilaginibacter antarcticus TaxID=1855725 RepID=A0ABW5XUU5_9SPHI
MKRYFTGKLFTAILLGGAGFLLLPSYVINKPVTPADETAPALNFSAQAVVNGLQSPVDMAFLGNGDMLIAEQSGKVRLVRNGKLQAQPVLDLSSKFNKLLPVDVRGLLGIALHPKFNSNRKIYVFYTAPTSLDKIDHTNIIAEYVLPKDMSQLDANNGKVILTTDQPGQGDNGGCLRFGPDGYLYLAIGDGGGGGDRHGPVGNGQNLNTLLSKILRIDVNTAATMNVAYSIPKDNPFVGKADVKPEIWAYGLRNAWRFSFDKATKQLFTADVGEGLYEEVDIVEKGGNYGWRMIEGNHCFNPKEGCDFNGTIKPITEYDHKSGISIIGGYVYNGKQLPTLKGKYLFADWAGPLYYIQKTGAEWHRGKVTLRNYPENIKVIAFGEDPSGELYVIANGGTLMADVKGAIYKVTN